MARENKDEPVTLMHRIAGNVVDLVVLDFFALPLYGVIQAVSVNSDEIPLWLITVGLLLAGLLFIFYMLFFWTRVGRTPGMTAVGLRLVNDKGESPTLKQTITRFVVSLLPLPGLSLLGGIPALGGHPYQDRLSKTTVIRD
jgi:uncharacterized RDD family membrane protein YckC